jgi:hypothetical protein
LVKLVRHYRQEISANEMVFDLLDRVVVPNIGVCLLCLDFGRCICG